MRSLPRSRYVAAAIVTPLLMFGVTACGGDDDTTTPAASDTSPTDEPTAEPDDSANEVEGEEVENPEQLLADMVAAMRNAETAKVDMDLGTGTAEGEFSYADEHPDLAVTLDIGETGLSGMEIRYVDGVVYLAMPGLTPSGKFFKVEEGNTTLGPVVDQLKSLTPDASLELLSKSVRKMTDAGEEDIDGEQTTHYVLEVDSTEAEKLAGKTAPQGESLQYDIWVTEDNLIRRSVVNVMGMSLQMDFTEWGEPVDIEAPDADDIVKAPAGM